MRRRSFIPVIASLLACVGAAMAPDASTGASAPVVVTATVLSATNLDASLCAPGLAGITDLGFVQPGTTTRSSANCTVQFGSSNDTSSLRMYQTDTTAAALNSQGAWSQLNTSSGQNMGGVAITATRAWVAGSSGEVATSVNDGATWTAQTSNTFQVLEDVDAADATHAWAVGSSGVITATSNGTTWATQTSGVATVLNSVEPLSATTVVVVGAGGVVLKTTNGGTAWSTRPSGTAVGLVDVAATNAATNLWAVGYNGTIIRSLDAGETWSAQVSGVAQHLYGVSASDANRAWAVGQAGRILRTVNGGGTWTAQASGTASDLNDVVAVDALNAWAVGAGGTLLRTTDGGATWTTVTSNSTLALTGLAFTSGGVGIASAFSGKVVRSGLNVVADYNAATANWAGTGANAFGACLASLGGGAVAGGTGWVADTHATSGDCAADDLDPWNPVAATSTIVATAGTSVTAATASLRFGFRSSASQAPGVYAAPITFEVLAPG